MTQDPIPSVAVERFTFAMALITKHGAATPLHVASKLAEFTSRNDQGGVAFWQDIAERVLTITGATQQ